MDQEGDADSDGKGGVMDRISQFSGWSDLVDVGRWCWCDGLCQLCQLCLAQRSSGGASRVRDRSQLQTADKEELKRSHVCGSPQVLWVGCLG